MKIEEKMNWSYLNNTYCVSSVPESSRFSCCFMGHTPRGFCKVLFSLSSEMLKIADLYENDSTLTLTSTSGCVENVSVGLFKGFFYYFILFYFFFDPEPANVTFEMCFSTGSLCGKSRASHPTTDPGAGI